MALPFSSHAKHPVVWTMLFAGSVMNLWCLYYFIDEGDHSYIGDSFNPQDCSDSVEKQVALSGFVTSTAGLTIKFALSDFQTGTPATYKPGWVPRKYVIGLVDKDATQDAFLKNAASGGVLDLDFASNGELIVTPNPTEDQIRSWGELAKSTQNVKIVPGHCALTPHICSYATPEFKPSLTSTKFNQLSEWFHAQLNAACLTPTTGAHCALLPTSEASTVADIKAKITALIPPPSSFDSIVNLSIAAASIASAMFLLHLAHVVMGMLGMNTDMVVGVLDSMAFRVCQVLTLATIFVTIAFVYTTALTTVCFDMDFRVVSDTAPKAAAALQGTRHDSTLDSWGDASAGDVFGVTGLAIMYLSFAWMYAYDLSSNAEAERTYQLELPQLIAKSVLVAFLIFQFGVGVQYMVDIKDMSGSVCDTSSTKETVGLVFFWVTLGSGLVWALVVLWRMLEPKLMGTARAAVSTISDDADLWTKMMGLDTARKVEMCALVVRTLSFPTGIGSLYMARIEHPTCPGAAHMPNLPIAPAVAAQNEVTFGVLDKIGEDSWMVFSIIMVDFLLISYVTFLLNTTGTSAVSSLFYGHHK